jgi:hypothetical protein
MQDPNSESEGYAELSRHFIEKADEYLREGDRIQASEKGWGAVAEAVKSIAEERGWNHWGHRLLNDVAYQLSEEWNRPDVLSMYDAVEKLHINFYEDVMELDEIGSRLHTAESLLVELESLRYRPQPPPAIGSRSQRNRWRRLTGELLPPSDDGNT